MGKLSLKAWLSLGHSAASREIQYQPTSVLRGRVANVCFSIWYSCLGNPSFRHCHLKPWSFRSKGWTLGPKDEKVDLVCSNSNSSSEGHEPDRGHGWSSFCEWMLRIYWLTELISPL